MQKKCLALIVLVVAVLFTAACGGGSSGGSSGEATGTSTYSNSDYSFTLEYPAAWSQGEPPSSPLMGDVEFTTAFADASNMEEAQANGEKLTAALVMATHVPRELTKAEWRKLLKASATQMMNMPASVAAAGYYDMNVGEPEMTKMSGMPCLIVDLTFSTAEDTRQHDRYYMLGKGDLYYAVQLSAAEDRWQDDVGELEAIAQSFTIQ